MHNNLKHFRPKPIKKPVTLIVGIICSDGIVVSSDSQSTDEFGMARTDATKIYKVELSDGASGIIATAGSVQWGLQLLELIENSAKTSNLKHVRSFADLAEDANRQLKLRERKGSLRTRKDLKEHFREHRSVLLIANYFKNQPYIYTLTSDGLVSPTALRKQSYTSVGSSSAIADYILRSFDFSDMILGVGEMVAIYTVNEVIQAKDTYCDYPIQAGIVSCESGNAESRAILTPYHHAKFAWERIVSKSKSIKTQFVSEMLSICVEVTDKMNAETKAMEQRAVELQKEFEKLTKKQTNYP